MITHDVLTLNTYRLVLIKTTCVTWQNVVVHTKEVCKVSGMADVFYLMSK
ncbi:hypothetical protein IODZLFCR_CDS0034 [Salmonella phage vB_SalP_SE29]|uniref:Uncharacterized protein n=1 Tax=Salmonella phage vB_SalP_SE29 TaxID=3134913 RepID=A0AAX4LXH2_9CAUD